MTVSNSKLDRDSKADRKVLLAALTAAGGQIFSFPNAGWGVTIAVMPEFEGSRTMRVAVAVASPAEEKFRRKVGEYVALCHMDDGQSIAVPAVDPDNMLSFAEDFAYAMTIASAE